jgi:D-sedoheptulose 7-phosphate isomerase
METSTQEKIKAELNESVAVKNLITKKIAPQIETAIKWLVNAFKNRNKVIFFGNGGSAADAQHLTAELVGRYKKDRKALPAIALTTDTSVLTSLSNDYGFETIFSKQIESLANKGDIAIGISTSGNSRNVIVGIEKARELGCQTIGLLGCDGGRIAEVVDLPIIVPSYSTPRIQECHITIGHIICGIVEQEIFPS